MTMLQQNCPKWLQDLVGFLPATSQFVLAGNIRDTVLCRSSEGKNFTLTIRDALWLALEALGFESMLEWDVVDGLRAFPPNTNGCEGVSAVTGGLELSAPLKMGLVQLGPILRNVGQVSRQGRRVALVIDYASRISEIGQMRPDAGEFFSVAEKGAVESVRAPVRHDGELALFNPVIWLVNRHSDLPFWLSSDNGRTRILQIPLPDADGRRSLAELELDGIGRWVAKSAVYHEVARMTDGMTLNALRDLVRMAEPALLSVGENVGDSLSVLDDAVRRFRVGDGSTVSPWRSDTLRESIRDAECGTLEQKLGERVRGQKTAVTRVLDILKRTAIGLTGAQTSSSAARPRGVLFFAGPTGVGKTETGT